MGEWEGRGHPSWVGIHLFYESILIWPWLVMMKSVRLQDVTG